jgi:glycosyltransferase involved in cell wall biosynthesis
MKHLMWDFGVDPLVIPNGLDDEALMSPNPEAIMTFLTRLQTRTVLSKVARWDPDKRWLLAMQTVRVLKDQGWKPLLVARGGVEAHGAEVLAEAAACGLRVVERASPRPGIRDLLQTLEDVDEADVVNLRSPLDPESRRVLFRGSAAVLANSGREPFGLVGLETMAASGVACTGCTGEDYAVPGQNALVLETTDPWEFVGLFGELRAHPARERALRQAGLTTAKRFAWSHILQQLLLPRLSLLAHTKCSPESKARQPGVSMQEVQPTGPSILAAGSNSGHRAPWAIPTP